MVENTNRSLGGVAFPEFGTYSENPSNTGYLGYAFVSASDDYPYVAVHELLHLFGLGHDPNDSLWNLMYYKTTPAAKTKEHTAPKRLTPTQINIMRTNGIEKGYLK